MLDGPSLLCGGGSRATGPIRQRRTSWPNTNWRLALLLALAFSSLRPRPFPTTTSYALGWQGGLCHPPTGCVHKNWAPKQLSACASIAQMIPLPQENCLRFAQTIPQKTAACGGLRRPAAACTICLFVCLFVCKFTDSGSCRSVTLPRVEPTLPGRP